VRVGLTVSAEDDSPVDETKMPAIPAQSSVSLNAPLARHEKLTFAVA
jgi:hypothetical protein